MKVIRAEAMGLCFGVRDALHVARNVEAPEAVTIHGELVHNETVLIQLQQRGFRRTSEHNRYGLPESTDVLITAHGISQRERQRLEDAGKHLIDTTCPLVRRVHEETQQLNSQGYHVVVIGRLGHVEVQGIVEDLCSYEVVTTLDDVTTWKYPRFGIVCQTTTPSRMAEQIRLAIESRNPHAEIRFVNTVCAPTSDRQQAADRLCSQVDIVVVVGGANSNNTRQLVELCRELGTPAYQVQTAADLEPAWFTSCRTVGLTAGTSTLDETIEDVYRVLRSIRS